MQMAIIILSRFEKLEELLFCLAEEGVRGATVIESSGMAKVLGREGGRFFQSLHLYIPDREENRTIFTVVPDEQVPLVERVLTEVVGDLSDPDTAVLFCVPVGYTAGLGEKK